MYRVPRSALIAALAIAPATPALASYAFYVGKDLTDSGGVLIGGTGEEVSSHWLEIVPAGTPGDGDTVEVGVTDAATIPGRLIEIPQAAETYRYLSMFYSDYEGFPAPLTNGGINEHSVAVRDVWAPNRRELVDMTSTPQEGPQYSDLARLVMERATTAREGVELIGELIAEHGYSTYGGNTHLIADPEEGWVVWEFAGGEGLWAAERLGPDDVRVLYPGYIEDVPADYLDNPDFAGSENLFDFAVEQGWIEDGAESLNVFEVYGSQDDGDDARIGGFKYVSQAEVEDELTSMAPVSVEEMMTMVRDPRIADDEAGYGQVADLVAETDPDMVQIWVAPTGSVAAPFNPWWLGVQEVPAEYGQHRYLTKDAASSFLNPDFREQEATEFAGRTFKRLMYLTCSRPDTYLPIVVEALNAFEAESRDDLAWVETAARGLVDAGDRESAQALLTHYAATRANGALDLGNVMVDAFESHLRLTGGLTPPEGAQINDQWQGGETVNCLADADPDRTPDDQ